MHKVAALADEGELALKQHAVEQCPRRLLTSASGTSPDSHGSGSTPAPQKRASTGRCPNKRIGITQSLLPGR